MDCSVRNGSHFSNFLERESPLSDVSGSGHGSVSAMVVVGEKSFFLSERNMNFFCCRPPLSPNPSMFLINLF